MKNTFKKVMGALMVAVLMMGVLAVPTQKAQAARQVLIKYAPRCTTALDYRDFVKELLEGAV